MDAWEAGMEGLEAQEEDAEGVPSQENNKHGLWRERKASERTRKI